MTPQTLILGPSGVQFPLGNPQPQHISMRHIASVLSKLPACGGLTRRFYSLAEHALVVSLTFERTIKMRRYLMWSLLHDAYFAYCPISPHYLVPPSAHKITRETIQAMIYDKFKAGDTYASDFQKVHEIVESAELRELAIFRHEQVSTSADFRFASALLSSRPASYNSADAERDFYEFWRTHIPSSDSLYT